MSIGNLILGVNRVTQSYLIRYDSLLQIETAILLQNPTDVYYKMHQVFYYKMRQFYYKTRQLLQTATIYYKIRYLLQNATFIRSCDSTNVAFLPKPSLDAHTVHGLRTPLSV